MKALSLALIAWLALAGLATPAVARDLDHERLSRSLAELEADPTLAPYAGIEIASARAALAGLLENNRGKRRAHALYMAERRVDIAWAAARLADLDRQQRALQSEHDGLLVLAARREAEQARRELERQHLQAQIRAEEAERATREADEARQREEEATASAMQEVEQSRRLLDAQAREAELSRKEAEITRELADAEMRARLESQQPERVADGLQMTIDDEAFGAGRASLRPQARNALGGIVAFLEREPAKAIRIEGHADSSGKDEANRVISRKRAESVRDALVAAGIDAGRIRVTGHGSDQPRASNDTAEGRARNRRVAVVILD